MNKTLQLNWVGARESVGRGSELGMARERWGASNLTLELPQITHDRWAFSNYRFLRKMLKNTENLKE